MRLRRWKGRTKVLQTTSRYSAVAIALHWVIALLIVANIALGLGHELFGRANELAIMAAHKSIGLTILALSLLRLAWRLSHRPPPLPARSEEHTSELQSLMRISYAVFCLKKKK